MFILMFVFLDALNICFLMDWHGEEVVLIMKGEKISNMYFEAFLAFYEILKGSLQILYNYMDHVLKGSLNLFNY